MFKRIILFAVLALLSIHLFGQTQIDKPVAIVKLTRTDVISKKKLDYNISLYENQTSRELGLEEKKQVLDTLINQMLVFQAAERDNVTVSDEQVLQVGMNQLMQQLGRQVTESQYRQIIKEQTGMDYDIYKEEIRKQLILEKYVTEKKRDFIMRTATPSADEIQLFYQQNEAKFLNPEMVRISHIFFAAKGLDSTQKAEKRDQAQQVLQQLNSGSSSFSQLVREYSEDKNSIVRDGDLGSFMDRGEQNIAVFGKDFINAVFDMSTENEIKLLESTQGFHIVKVTQHRDKRFLELDDPVSPVQTQTVREYIRNFLGMQKQQQAFQIAAKDVVDSLVEEAEIQRFPDNIE